MSIKVTVNWYGGRVSKVVNSMLIAGGDAVGKAVSQEAKRLVSRPNPGGLNPSAPGEPPKMVTGELKNTINYVVTPSKNKVTVQVGASAEHALYLEFGTHKMAPRPFMRPAIANSSGEIVGLFTKG